MMTIRKMVLITAIFLLALTGARLLWNHIFSVPAHPEAVRGVLDLRDWELPANRTITLNGEWEFYPDLFLMQNADHAGSPQRESRYIQVPGDWNASWSTDRKSPYGYGSYRLRILTDPSAEPTYRIRINSIRSSSEIFVDGRLSGSMGQPAASAEAYTARNVPYSVTFAPQDGETEIVIQVANYDLHSGGIVGSIRFGTDRAVENAQWFSISMQVTVSVIFLVHALYAVILFWIGHRRSVLLYFALLIISAILTILLGEANLLVEWVPLSFDWNMKLISLSYFGASCFLLEFVKRLLPEYSQGRVLRWFSRLCVIYALFILLRPIEYTLSLGHIRLIVLLLPLLTVLALVLRTAVKGDKNAVFLLLSATAITTNLLFPILGLNLEGNYYPVNMIVCCISFATYWFKRYFQTSAQAETLAGKLLEELKRKDEFLANTSHELRNPLHGMLNIAQTMLDSGRRSLGGKNARNLEMLITVGRRMSLMLGDLLDMTRLRERGIRLRMSAVRLQSVAAGVFDMLRFMTEGKPVRLVNDIPDALPAVLADENRLIQILFNLLHNAVKYTHEGTIAIRADLEDGQVTIRITDTGIGMDEETQRRIFQPYEQGDSGRTATSGGIGLGLSISQQLVELHGGTLAVRSVPGEGSTFFFTLRAADPALHREEATSHPPWFKADAETAAASSALVDGEFDPVTEPVAAEHRTRILAVDDDPVNLHVLAEMLALERCEIVTATSGKEALAILGTGEWDLIVADVMMPHMSGYELARIVRERFSLSELPILLLTARSRPEDVEAGFRSGANDYVTKPVDAAELKSRVRALAGMKKSAKERLRLEAAWLQAQIQPHFLFNTLNAVIALSHFDTDRMRDLLVAFGDYLRASFDSRNSGQLVPLEHEIGLVRSYLLIEQARFEDRLNIIWEVDEGAQVRLPPLSIQPLVENAVRHGLKRRAQAGVIRIRIADYEDRTEISVEDNGVGMDEETARRLLDGRPDDRIGIGLQNTDRRLKQTYGEGLRIRSAPNEGTTVAFTVKK